MFRWGRPEIGDRYHALQRRVGIRFYEAGTASRIPAGHSTEMGGTNYHHHRCGYGQADSSSELLRRFTGESTACQRRRSQANVGAQRARDRQAGERNLKGPDMNGFAVDPAELRDGASRLNKLGEELGEHDSTRWFTAPEEVGHDCLAAALGEFQTNLTTAIAAYRRA